MAARVWSGAGAAADDGPEAGGTQDAEVAGDPPLVQAASAMTMPAAVSVREVLAFHTWVILLDPV
nr:hypothetical protein Ade03nite_75480 [Actinoplanes derwentensis]